MPPRAAIVLAVLVLSCRGGRVEVGPDPTADAPEAESAEIGRVVAIDAFEWPRCALDGVAFRDAKRGYVRDACGQIFGTVDGGTSFVALHREDGLHPGWRPRKSPFLLVGEHLLDFGFSKSVLRASEDRGQTFRMRLLPVAQDWLGADAAGDTVWACGSEGVVAVSHDRGLDFRITPSSPFRAGEACTAIVARDAKRAIAARGDGATFATDDGGATWRPVHEAIEHLRAQTTAVRIAPSQDALLIDAVSGTPRRVPIRRAGTVFEPILGTAKDPFGLVAWTAHGFLERDAAGGPLIARVRLREGAIAIAVRPLENTRLVRTRDGRVHRGRGEWFEPADALDEWLLERRVASASGGPVPRSPLERMLTGTGELELNVRRESCGDSYRPVTLLVRADRGTLSVAADGAPGRVLSATEAAKLRAALATAWELPDRPAYPAQGLHLRLRRPGEALVHVTYRLPSPRGMQILDALGVRPR